MNPLEARRRLLADPRHVCAELQSALEGSPGLADFREELLALDDEMRSVLTHAPVPDGLAERLVLHARYGHRSRWALALAAGLVALAVAVPWYRIETDAPLETAMMDHVVQGVDELRDDRGVEPAVLRASVAGIGVRVRDAGYRVRHLGHCVVAGREGRHFTIDGPHGVVSFLVLPAKGDAGRAESVQRGGTLGVFTRRDGLLIGVFGETSMRRADLEKIMEEVLA
jgi:Protein of unknown function (DUF3379)